jgi:hypothetical protein
MESRVVTSQDDLDIEVGVILPVHINNQTKTTIVACFPARSMIHAIKRSLLSAKKYVCVKHR